VEAAHDATGRPRDELDRRARGGPLALGAGAVGEVLRLLEERFGCRLDPPPDPGALDVPAVAVTLGEGYQPPRDDLELPDEHGILLVKPDAPRRGLLEHLPALLRDFGLDAVREVETRLDPEAVPSLTHRRDPATLAYLASGPVRILLVRGRDALELTYRLKHRARKDLGVHERIYNLIHACDAGNEVALFLRTFFPRLDGPRLRGSVDQLWVVPGPADPAALEEGLARARRAHPAGTVVPVLERGSPEAPASGRVDGALELLAAYGQPYLGLLERVPLEGWAEPVETVSFLGPAPSRTRRGGCALIGPADRLPALARTLGDRLRDRFESMLCYHPAWSLRTVEELSELARSRGVVPLCGSGASDRPFVLANSAAGMRELEGAMLRRAWRSR
jgi:hypothetical protein